MGHQASKISPQSGSGLYKGILRLALPMAGSRLLQMLTGFIGMLMLARLGHEVLAAGMLMTSTMVSTLVVLISLLFSLSVVVGQAYGAKRYHEIGTIIQQGCCLALLMALPTMCLFFYADRILLAMGQLPQLLIYVRQYFHALIWGVPAFMVQAALQQALYGMSRQRLVIIVNLICLLVFIPAAYFLIYGAGSFHGYGVPGLLRLLCVL